MSTGAILGVWEGLVTAIADEMAELAGYLLTRTAAPTAPGAVTIEVESTHRFPATGRFVVEGVTGAYTGLTPTALTGVTAADGSPWVAAIRPRAPLMDASRTHSQLDDLRAGFIVSEAEGAELNTLARNNGIERQRGLDDATFAALLQVLIFLEAQTVYACEQVLDAVYGAGNYELIERLESDMHTIFVRIPFVGGAGGDSQGKTYLNGGEAATATGVTVDVEYDVITPYGVYSAADPLREGVNYANATVACTADSGAPTALGSLGLWLPADAGKGIVLTLDGVQQWWTIAEVVDPNEIALHWAPATGAQVDSGTLDVVRLDYDRWAPWVVGSSIVVAAGVNAGSHVIAEYLSPREVRVAAPMAADADFGWELYPAFATGVGSAAVPRATAAGNTITTPVAMPVSVLVDYTSVLSAQLVANPGVNGNAQYPFYLWDETAIVQSLLDLVTASGVTVVVEQT